MGSITFLTADSPGGSSGDILTENRTYYVRTDGSDANTGLVDSAGGAFLTIQHAFDVAAALSSVFVDGEPYTLAVNVGAGTFDPASLRDQFFPGFIILTGAGSANTIVETTVDGVDVFTFTNCRVEVGGMTVRENIPSIDSSPHLFLVVQDSKLNFNDDVKFQSMSTEAVRAVECAVRTSVYFNEEVNFEIEGDFRYFLSCSENSSGEIYGVWTLTDTPDWSEAFLKVSVNTAFQSAGGFVIDSGTATGKRFIVESNSIVTTDGEGLELFPGDSAGTTATGGTYDDNPNNNLVAIVVDLPTASDWQGMRALVTDASTSLLLGLGTIVAGSGSNIVPVYSDGTDWRIG